MKIAITMQIDPAAVISDLMLGVAAETGFGVEDLVLKANLEPDRLTHLGSTGRLHVTVQFPNR